MKRCSAQSHCSCSHSYSSHAAMAQGIKMDVASPEHLERGFVADCSADGSWESQICSPQLVRSFLEASV